MSGWVEDYESLDIHVSVFTHNHVVTSVYPPWHLAWTSDPQPFGIPAFSYYRYLKVNCSRGPKCHVVSNYRSSQLVVFHVCTYSLMFYRESHQRFVMNPPSSSFCSLGFEALEAWLGFPCLKRERSRVCDSIGIHCC